MNDRGHITIDENHEFLWVTDSSDEHSSAERPPNPIGIIEYHRKPDGDWCGGYAYFTGHGPPDKTWTVNSWDPLDLSPSLACPTCGSHGYIRQGKWVPA